MTVFSGIVFDRQDVLKLLVRGGRLAAVRIMSGGLGIAFIATVLLRIDHAAVVAYGVGSTVFSIFTLLLSGFYLTVIRGAGDGLGNSLLLSGSAAILMSVVFCLLCALFGIVWNFYSIQPDLLLYFNAYFWLRIVTLPLIAMTNVFGGAFVFLGQENKILLNSLIDSFFFLLTGIVISVFFMNSPLWAIYTIVISRVIADIFFFFRYYYGLHYLKKIDILSFFRQAFLLFWTRMEVIRRLALSAFAGTGDIVILLGAFWVIQILVAPVDIQLAAYTSFGISIARLFVSLLKAFGTIAGSIVIDKQITEEQKKFADMSVALMLAIYLPIGLLAIVSGYFFIPVFYDDAGILQVIFIALGIQLSLEPFGAYLSGMLKIIISPGSTLKALFLLVWIFVVPVIAIAFSMNILSVYLLWGTLVCARVFFALYCVQKYRRHFENNLRVSPELVEV